MKTRLKYSLIAVFIFSLIPFVQAQKKNKVRIKASLINIVDQGVYLEIQGSSRINKKNTKVPGLTYTIFDETQEESKELGTVTSDDNGSAKFVIPNFNSMESDSTGFYNLRIVFDGDESFSKARKSVSFKNAIISANIFQKDSVNFITAKLIDGKSRAPISDESLTTQVQRLFSPLPIGEEFNMTDEEGNIEVEIPGNIPGINGMLNLEVVLSDSDDYGTVKKVISAPVGTVIEVDNTFNERTLWSTRDKTPIFMLIFTNLLIIGILVLFIYLTRNLIKISKS